MANGKRRYTTYGPSPIVLTLASRPTVRSLMVSASQAYSVSGRDIAGKEISGRAYCKSVGDGLAHFIGFGSDEREVWEAKVRVDSITPGPNEIRELGTEVEVTRYSGGTAGHSQLAKYAKSANR